MSPRIAALALVTLMIALHPAPALGQGDTGRCLILCAPELTIAPSLTIENLFGGPRMEDLVTGEVVREGRAREFELFVAMDIPTTIPRFELTFEAIWTPFAGTSENPFTRYSAEDLGREEIHDNPVELELELKFFLVKAEETAGWFESHFDIVDQYSPAERPDDARTYTHKLNFEVDAAVAIFNWLPTGNWLRNLEAEASFDHLATGLPAAGDVVPRGTERFLDDASPWSLTLSVIIPVAPLRP